MVRVESERERRCGCVESNTCSKQMRGTLNCMHTYVATDTTQGHAMQSRNDSQYYASGMSNNWH